jgi:hypothetical protein
VGLVCAVLILGRVIMWRSIFNEGNKILFRVGLAILALNVKSILATKNYQDLFMLFKALPHQMYDCEMLMKVCILTWTLLVDAWRA